MGKQTLKKSNTFGGEWTKEKLIIVDKYLKFYINALKNFKYKKIYIDAFAGSGLTTISSGETLEGSALKSLQYDFDFYYFLDINPDNIAKLSEQVEIHFPCKKDKIKYIAGDSNTELVNLLDTLTKTQRGVIFLDPYAMELEWNILEKIKNTGILDVWYLFPFSAVNRNLFKNGKMPKANKEKINRILGDSDWERSFYQESNQLNMFNEINYEKVVDTDGIRKYIIEKMKKIFPFVSEKSKFLKNKNNAPIFLLCYAISNDSPKAMSLGNKVVKDIINSIEGAKNGK